MMIGLPLRKLQTILRRMTAMRVARSREQDREAESSVGFRV